MSYYIMLTALVAAYAFACSNVDNLTNELQKIQSFLSTKERVNTRLMSRKFNVAFNSQNDHFTKDIHETESLFKQLQIAQSDDEIDQIIQAIAKIYESGNYKNVLNEEYSLKLPSMIRDYNYLTNSKHWKQLLESFGFVGCYKYENGRGTYKMDRNGDTWLALNTLGILEKMLVISSIEIFNLLSFGFQSDESKIAWLDCMKLVYEHCWNELAEADKIPSFDQVYYLNDNEEISPHKTKHLKELIKDWKLKIIHPNYINQSWNHDQMYLHSIDRHENAKNLVIQLVNLGRPVDVSSFDADMLEIKFITKWLQSMNGQGEALHVRWKNGQYSGFYGEREAFGRVIGSIEESVFKVFQNEHDPDDRIKSWKDIEPLITALKQNSMLYKGSNFDRLHTMYAQWKTQQFYEKADKTADEKTLERMLKHTGKLIAV